jgi:hypothetical protein
MWYVGHLGGYGSSVKCCMMFNVQFSHDFRSFLEISKHILKALAKSYLFVPFPYHLHVRWLRNEDLKTDIRPTDAAVTWQSKKTLKEMDLSSNIHCDDCFSVSNHDIMDLHVVWLHYAWSYALTSQLSAIIYSLLFVHNSEYIWQASLIKRPHVWLIKCLV